MLTKKKTAAATQNVNFYQCGVNNDNEYGSYMSNRLLTVLPHNLYTSPYSTIVYNSSGVSVTLRNGVNDLIVIPALHAKNMSSAIMN